MPMPNNKFKKGEKAYWLTSFPNGEIVIVTILSDYHPIGEGYYYIAKPKGFHGGGSDTTDINFLFKIKKTNE